MKNSTKMLALGVTASGLAASMGVALVAYVNNLRPRLIRWGASDEEINHTYPGDSLVLHPNTYITHAITINAPPSKVFPYLRQLGRGRGGFYSYSFVENNLLGLGIRNADTIEPELQNMQAADRVPWTKDFVLETVMLQEDKIMVLHNDSRVSKPGESPKMRPGDYLNLSWAFYLNETHDGHTRLIERMRIEHPDKLQNKFFYRWIFEPGSFLMQQRMLMGIKERVEGLKKSVDTTKEAILEVAQQNSTGG